MASVISIVQNAGSDYAGASQEVAKNISYFLPIDSTTASKTDNPITLPESGTRYSYEVWIRLRCDLAPNDRVDNIKAWYDSGLPATGQNITVNSDTVNTYQTPINLQSNRGTRVDFDTKASEGDSISLSGTLQNVGDYSSWLVFQLEVLSNAETGEFDVDYIIQYDEY